MKKIKTRFSNMVILVILLIIGLSLAKILVSHNLTTAGKKVQEQELKMAELELENRRIIEEISSLGSLVQIASQASQLGLVQASQILHISAKIPVALK